MCNSFNLNWHTQHIVPFIQDKKPLSSTLRGFLSYYKTSRYKLQYKEDIIKDIRVERNKWKLATINVNIEQNESILNDLGVDLEEIKERVKKQNEKRKQGRDVYEKGS